MSDLAVVLRAAALLALILIPGAAVSWATTRRGDAFGVVLWGLAVVSASGVMLARWGAFSLTSVGCVAGAIAAVIALAGAAAAPRARATSAPRFVRAGAGLAGIVACLWAWPPFETFMGAADSTMYVDAGIHLARTGSYDVPNTVASLLDAETARVVFPSVGVVDRGPFIRLPGGLLMSRRDAASSTPAFFPLLSVWTGLLAAVGGPPWATAVAPLGTGLAVWALALFAGEAFGLAAALSTALVFLGNFAVWWFGRFPMSEPLTVAFVWGGLVFLQRGAPLAAGIMLGLGGLARTETLLFVGAGVAFWAAWTPTRGRDVLALLAGVALAGALAGAGVVAAPNHHVAYLWNDLTFAWARTYWRALAALSDGRLVVAAALLPIAPLALAIGAWWYGRDVGRNTIRLLVLLAVVIGVSVYLRVGGRAEPVRHVGWLATSMSPLGLLLAVVGAAVVWSRGGPAVRLAAVLVVLVALVFVPSPRVASYQPWAMRRYLPIMLPGLALAAGAALGVLFDSRARGRQLVAAALVAIVVGLQIRPVLAVRDAGYYGQSLAGVERVAAHIPSDALVVVDGGFADLQVQVPLWLVFGRETVMVTGSTALWREVLTRLLASGRPVYWIQNQLAPAPEADGLVFTAVALGKDGDLAIRLPDSPADAPPGFVSRRWAPLSLYGVRGGAALGAVAGACPSPACFFSLGSKTVRTSQSAWVMIRAVNVTV